MKGRKEIVNVKLYDIHENLYKKYTNKDSLPEWLINTNQKFFQHEVSQILANDYTKVIIAEGSENQDKFSYTNSATRPLNQDRIHTLPLIQGYFNKNLKCEAVMDPFWMSDIYAGQQAGDSYKAALRELHQASKKEQHVQSVLDPGCIATLYVHAHRALLMNPEADQIVIDYYHEAISHISSLYIFFDHNQILLPKKVLLHLRQFDESKLSQHLQVNIEGTGEVDPQYEWSARYLESQYYQTVGRNVNPRNINSANDLATYHYENSYHAAGRKSAMDINLDTFDQKKFLKFRSQEIHPNLAAMNLLGHESRYTTAMALCQAGLLPEKYALDFGVNKNAAAEKAAREKAAREATAVEVKPPVAPDLPSPPIPNKEPTEPLVLPAANNIVKEKPASVSAVDVLPETTPSRRFEFEVVKPPVTDVPAADNNKEIEKKKNSDLIKTVEADNATATTRSSKPEEPNIVTLTAPSREFVLTGAHPATDDDLIIKPDDVYTSQLETDAAKPGVETKTELMNTVDADRESDSDSDSHSETEEIISGKVSTSTFLAKKKAGNIDATEYLQKLFEKYSNPNSGFTISMYIKTLRNSSQVHQLAIPNEFNALSAIKNIARQPFWKSEGSSMGFWGKVPNGIDEIVHKDPATLGDLHKQLKENLESRSSSYFHGSRSPKTSEFYDLIMMMCEKGIDDPVRFVAINAFCQKWKIAEAVMEVEISPDFIYRFA